jgi:hypothetical protein
VNLSVRGMLLEVPKPILVGTTMDLSFVVPGEDLEVNAVGQVVRTAVAGDGAQLVGVKILIVDDADRDRLARFVEQASQAPAASAS